MPVDTKEMTEVGVDREDFESTGDGCFWEPWHFPGEFDKSNGMVEGGIVGGEVLTRDQAIDAGDGTAMGCWKIDDDAFLSEVLPVCDTKGADVEARKRRTGEWSDHETFDNFLNEQVVNWRFFISKAIDGCVVRGRNLLQVFL